MPARIFLVLVAIAFVVFLGGCATADRPATTEADPMLQKSTDDHAVHGEVGAFYGHSVGH